MLKIASLFAPAVVALLVATSAGAQAPDPAKPGVVEAEVVKLQATVTAVDRADRAVALRGEDGREVEVDLSDQVKNFDQIKAGDTVTVTTVRGNRDLRPQGRRRARGCRSWRCSGGSSRR